jgi:hypothetical protein
MKIDEKRSTTSEKVQKLQSALQAKAKAEPGYRFYSLLRTRSCAGMSCMKPIVVACKRRSRGVDGETFEHADRQGLAPWLEQLREELQTGREMAATPSSSMDTQEQVLVASKDRWGYPLFGTGWFRWRWC